MEFVNFDLLFKNKQNLQNVKYFYYRDAVIVFGAAYNPDVSNSVYYGLGNTVHTSSMTFVFVHWSF
jgi:hypothetical protein